MRSLTASMRISKWQFCQWINFFEKLFSTGWQVFPDCISKGNIISRKITPQVSVIGHYLLMMYIFKIDIIFSEQRSSVARSGG